MLRLLFDKRLPGRMVRADQLGAFVNMSTVLEIVVACITIPANVGVWTAVGFVVRWYWDQRRWMRFRRSLHRLGEFEDYLPDDLNESDWKALTAMTLSDAGFAPAECLKFLDLGMHIALGEASVTFQRYKEQDGKLPQET